MRRLLELTSIGSLLFALGTVAIPAIGMLTNQRAGPAFAGVADLRGCVSCLDDPFFAFASFSDVLPFEDFIYLTLGVARQHEWTRQDVDWLIREIGNSTGDRRQLFAEVVSWSIADGLVIESSELARLSAVLEQPEPANRTSCPDPF